MNTKFVKRAVETLIIVDMQKKFSASNDRELIANIKREIATAAKNNNPIIILEYCRYGRTLESLRKFIDKVKYKKVYTVIKNTDDGAKEVVNTIRHLRLPKSLRVVGVNTMYCVHDTVRSLSNNAYCNSIKEINVVADACNSRVISDHVQALTYMSELKKVKII